MTRQIIANGKTYTSYDRANRLLQVTDGVNTTTYAYDGLGNRMSQDVNGLLTRYLLDLQPGLAVVLAETTGANTIRNVHAPRGIHAHKDAGGAWEWMMQDGLGSVRGVVDNSVGVLWSGSPAPYGEYFDESGTRQTSYGFTGEPMDNNGLLYLRARYYNPVAGVFTALDPFEGISNRAMSLNGYSWVEGNVCNMVDPSGMSMCGIPFLLPIVQDDSPDGLACDLRQKNGRNALLWTALRETSPDPNEPLRKSEYAKAALMIMQINAYESFGSFRPIGNKDSLDAYKSITREELISVHSASDREFGLANLFENAYCNKRDPLAYFEDSNVSVRQSIRNAYPDIASNLEALKLISQDNELSFEVSFAADRLANVMDQIQRGDFIGYPIVPSGATRGIMIGNEPMTRNISIFNQCPEGWTAVLRDGVDPNALGKREGRDFDCTRCQDSTRLWYVTEDGSKTYTVLTEVEAQAKFASNTGARGYVKSCTAQ